ncbi:MAG: ABC transporter permease [Filifactoraceae bacterium]
MVRKSLNILPVLFFIIFIVSITMTVLLSMFSYYKYPVLIPEKFSMEYWVNIIKYNSLFKDSILYSLQLGILNGIFVTLVGFLTGKGIVEARWNRDINVMMIYSFPLLIPSTALFVSIHSLMIDIRLNNTILGVVLAQSLIAIPYSTNIAVSFFEGFSKDIILIGRTLGATDIELFRRIYFKAMLPSLSLSFGISFLLSTSEYFSAFLIGGGKIITLSTLYYPYINNADYGSAAVLSIVFIVINVVALGIVEFFSKARGHGNPTMFGE